MYAQPDPDDEDAKDTEHPDSAVATLRRQMLFYRDQAAPILEKIINLLKSQGARGDLAAMMYKYLQEANKLTIECASKLAPYESARLQAIEVTQKKVTKFVIEAPARQDNPELWLSNTKEELRLISQIKKEAEEAVIIDNNGNIESNPNGNKHPE